MLQAFLERQAAAVVEIGAEGAGSVGIRGEGRSLKWQ